MNLFSDKLFSAVVAVGVAAGLFATVQTKRLENAQAANRDLSAQLEAFKEGLRLSEQLRGQEQEQAIGAYDAQTDRCAERITTARDAAQAIEEIVNGQNVSPGKHGAVATDVRANDVPGGRGIVGADSLRRIIGQASGGAAGMSTGSEGTSQ